MHSLIKAIKLLAQEDLSGLAAEAIKAGSFEEFKKDFILQTKHGVYWHITDNPNFEIDPTTGPRDFSSLGNPNVIKHPGTLMITSHLEHWEDFYNIDPDSDERSITRPYAALIDMSDVPRNIYYQVNRGFGNEFMVTDINNVNVINVMSIEEALAYDEAYNSKLPNSEEALREFYNSVVGEETDQQSQGIVLQNCLKLLAFPFLAQPPEMNPYKGIMEYPGFHTTKNFDIAAQYALGKIRAQEIDEDENGVHYTTDYPVVVALNMENYTKELDYDAAIVVKTSLENWLDNIIKELPEDPTDDDIDASTQDALDFIDMESNAIDSEPLSFLSENAFYHFNSPLGGIMDEPYYPEMVREYIRTKTIPDQVLMDAADQYRYTEDVDAERILAVWYVVPVSNEMAEYHQEDWNEEDFERRWPGFDIIGEDEAYGGYWSPTSQLILGEDPKGDVEYHGTTYKRLLQAAPNLDLPNPPSPPYREE